MNRAGLLVAKYYFINPSLKSVFNGSSPFEIQACSDVKLFKSKLKTHLFKKVYDI